MIRVLANTGSHVAVSLGETGRGSPPATDYRSVAVAAIGSITLIVAAGVEDGALPYPWLMLSAGLFFAVIALAVIVGRRSAEQR